MSRNLFLIEPDASVSCSGRQSEVKSVTSVDERLGHPDSIHTTMVGPLETARSLFEYSHDQ